ncbi:MAG: DUF1538 domain-containing protein [Coriobacteriia bacterium]|nr:DUF1538 domain-containing protein [Coriobacteriia bacterium]
MLTITILVLIFMFVCVPQPFDAAVSFIIGAVFLLIGMTLFTLGADIAMKPMGDILGSFIAGKKKIWFLALMGLVLGFIITITEPGLLVLAELAAGIPSSILIVSVAAGVGAFLAIAFLREVLHLSFRLILLIGYSILFIVACFVPENFLPLAFDSGGATTGSMTVPFIIALGVGIAFINRDNCSEDDNFGLIAICSIGPILTVMVLGLIYTPDNSSAEYAVYTATAAEHTALSTAYAGTLLKYTYETLLSLAPIVVVFLAFSVFAIKTPKKKMIPILLGILATYVGLVLFLTGAHLGFFPVGNLLGHHLAGSDYRWALVIAGMVFGYFVIRAEPAVAVLNTQVADITRGVISQKAMKLSLSIGVALAIGIAMLRVLTGLPIMWVLLPGYIISVGLAFVTPKIFTSVAFDSGGVASGPLTSAFLLPLAIGASHTLGGNAVTDAFGLIAMVAMTPLITIQILGLYYVWKKKKVKSA